MQITRKLPIGIQSFEDLRKNNYLYFDKTEFVFRLAETGKVYFLSRPRRFGKSLFLSTLKAFFEGKKELFKIQIRRLFTCLVDFPCISNHIKKITVRLNTLSFLRCNQTTLSIFLFEDDLLQCKEAHFVLLQILL